MSRKNRSQGATRKPATKEGDIISGGPFDGYQVGPVVVTAAQLSGADLNTADALINAALAGPLPPALGNMSEADLAAIRGAPAMTASEMLANGPMVTEGQPFTPEPLASPEEISLGARLLTLEQRFTELETAVERLAQTVTAPPRPTVQHIAAVPQSIAKPTPEEEAQYCETNLALSQQNERPYDGIQPWRDAGSPVMKAKPVVNPLQRGRAA